MFARKLVPVREIGPKDSRIKATTMSVVFKDSESVHCYVEVGGESCNLTLRFDRGLKAVLCGYPNDWLIHDVETEPYNSESPKGYEVYEAGMHDEAFPYVSADDEAEILKHLKRALSRQFKSKSWAKTCPKRRQQTLLNKVQRAIDSLKGA